MLRGGCFCGDIRYETDAPPTDETICHCTDCRRVVGAQAVAWFSVPATRLHITRGMPARFRSSAGVLRSFCGICGTSLFYASDAAGDEIDVSTSTLDDPDAVPPKDHVETATRPNWVVLCDRLPVYPGARAKS